MTDLFISYSRKNIDFVMELRRALGTYRPQDDPTRELNVWLDAEDIEWSVDWWERIRKGIEETNNFVAVISADYLASDVCHAELAYARENNKRVIPIIAERVDEADFEAKLAARTWKRGEKSLAYDQWAYLRRLNWINFERMSFDEGYAALLEAVTTDVAHKDYHTELNRRALQWHRHDRNRSYLLTGQQIEKAEHWLAEAVMSDPPPTSLQAEYVRASRAAQRRRQNGLLVGVSVALAVSLGLTVLSLLLFRQSNAQRLLSEERGTAVAQQASTATVAQGAAEVEADNAATQAALAVAAQATAERNAAQANSLAQAAQAARVFEGGQPLLAYTLLRAANSVPDAPFAVEQTLREIGYAPGPYRLFDDAEDVVRSVTYSPDGTQLLAASEDGRLRLWDVQSGEMVRAYTGHEAPVAAGVFTPDGARILSGAGDGAVYLWDTASGEIVHRMQGHTQPVHAVAVSPDGRYGVTGDIAGQIRVWDLDEATVFQQLERHTASVNAAVFSPDGALLATGGDDRRLVLWDWRSGEVTQQIDPTDEVTALAFTPDGRRLMVGETGADGLGMWSVTDGTPIRRFDGHNDTIIDVAISPDGQTMLSASFDNTIIVWNMIASQQQRRLTYSAASLTDLAFSPDGRRFAAGTRETNYALVWDLHAGDLLRAFDGPTDAVRTVDISPDGRLALSGNALADTITLWDMATGQPHATLYGHTGDVQSAVFSPDGRYIASGGTEGLALIWDAENEVVLRRLAGHEAGVNDVAFRPDGQRVLTGSADHTLILWDVASGAPLRTYDRHTEPVLAAAFHPDGDSFVSVGWDDVGRVWDAESARVRHTLRGHAGDIDAVAYSPDGRYIVTGGSDNLVILWDAETGQLLQTLSAHRNGVDAVAFGPGGAFMLSGSRDGTMVLWDVARREVAHTFTGIDGSVMDVAFSPDGRSALAAISDGVPLLWRVDTRAEMLAWMQNNRAVTITPFPAPTQRVINRPVMVTTPLAPPTANPRLADDRVETFALARPGSGEMIHDASDTAPVLVDSALQVDDFTAQVTYINPYGAQQGTWDYGFVFAPYVLLVRSGQGWELWNLAQDTPQARGPLPGLDTEPGGENSLRLIVRGDEALFYVNDTPTANLDGLTFSEPISVLLISGFISGNEITGAATGYRDFTIRTFEEPTPTATPAPAQRQATVGTNMGSIPPGGGQGWQFTGEAGQVINIRARAARPANEADAETRLADNLLDTQLLVRAPDGRVLARADDINIGLITDAQITDLALPAAGTYIIEVRSWLNNTSGEYTLEITPADRLPTATPPPPTLTPAPTPDVSIPTGGDVLLEVRRGELPHSPLTPAVPVFVADVFQRDFVLSVTFQNPYDADTAPWDYGVVFRQVQDRDYTLIVRSEGEWLLLRSDAGDATGYIIARGPAPLLDRSANGQNRLELVAQADVGYLVINGQPAAELDLSTLTQAGDIRIGSGFFPGAQAEDGLTVFESFTLRSVE